MREMLDRPSGASRWLAWRERLASVAIELKIYMALTLGAIRSKMEYRVAFIFMFFAIIVFYLAQLGVILVVIGKFGDINGWSLGEMTFLYGLLVFSQALSSLLFSPLVMFERHIVEGTFDRYLLRPLNPLGQLLAGDFEISSAAHFLIGLGALVYGSINASIEWGFMKALFLILTLIGAVLIQGAVRIIVSAVAFWTKRNRSLVHLIVFSTKEFILYPISIYGLWAQIFLTTVFPIAFINYYPSHYFLARDGSELLFSPLIQYMTPLVGVTVFAVGHMIWKIGARAYQSAGH